MGLFELEPGVKFVDSHINDIVQDTVLFEYQPSQTRTKYLRLVQLAKLLLNNIKPLPVLERLRTEAGTGKNLGICHLECILYSLEPDEVELMIEATE